MERGTAPRSPHRRVLGHTVREACLGITVVDHPLAATMLTALRDVATPPPLFRLLAKRLALTLVVEASRTVPVAARKVTTPLAETDGTEFAVPLVAVPILRAGLGMVEAVTELFPEVAVGYIGLERDHATFQPSAYYTKLPALDIVTTAVDDGLNEQAYILPGLGDFGDRLYGT